MLTGAVNALQWLQRLFRAEARRIGDHHLGQPDDGVERRAQLVAHAGDELRLVLARHCELAALVLDLAEQARVLDRQHRLGREGLKQVDRVWEIRPAPCGGPPGRPRPGRRRAAVRPDARDSPRAGCSFAGGGGLQIGGLVRLARWSAAPTASEMSAWCSFITAIMSALIP